MANVNATCYQLPVWTIQFCCYWCKVDDGIDVDSTQIRPTINSTFCRCHQCWCDNDYALHCIGQWSCSVHSLSTKNSSWQIRRLSLRSGALCVNVVDNSIASRHPPNANVPKFFFWRCCCHRTTERRRCNWCQLHQSKKLKNEEMILNCQL